MTRVPSYRLHKSSGLAVCTINGKDHYLGPHGSKKSLSEYKRLIAEWQAAKRQTSFGIAPADVTIAMLICDYLDFCADHYPKDKHNSETNQTRVALDWLDDYLETKAADFGPLRLKAVRQTMIDATSEATGKPLSRQYINKLVDRIVRMFRWGAENEMLPITVHQALANVKGLQKRRTTAPEAVPVKPVEAHIVEATIVHCTQVVQDMIRLQRVTGMRPGEICALTPGFIDRRGEVWVAKLPEHKSAWRNQNRCIYFGPKAQSIILPYLLRADDAALFSPKEADKQRREKLRQNRTTPLNCGNREGTNRKAKPEVTIGESYKTSSYARAILHACNKAFPIPDDASDVEAAAWRKKWWWSPNQIRHSRATEIRQQFGLEAAQVALGHTRMDTTQIYAEICQQKGVELAAKIG